MHIYVALQNWLGKHRREGFVLLVLLTLGAGVLLRTLHLAEVQSRSPDERVYVGSAHIIAEQGLSGFRQIFSDYAADRSKWIYPAPTRIGHELLFAALMKVTGSTSAQAGAAVSWTLSILSLLALFWIGRRFFNGWVGLAAALFLATYVVDLEFARRAWGEATASFCSLLLFGFTLEVARRPRQWGYFVGFFAAGMACLLVKETSLFAYGLCGLWLLRCLLFQARDRAAALLLIAGGVLSLAASFALLATLAGGAHLAWVGLYHAFGAGLGSDDWGARNASGPWFEYLHMLWILAPFTLVMAAFGLWAVVARSARTDLDPVLDQGWRSAASLALLLSGAFIAISSFGPNLKYMRIMAPANGPYCLLAGLGVAFIVAHAPLLRGIRYPIVLALLPIAFVLTSVRDHAFYRDVVVHSGMQDMALSWILKGRTDAGRGAPHSEKNTFALSEGDAALNRSLEFCQHKQYQECVRAALSVVARHPRQAVAWNNAAAGYAGLGRWDDAIRCAQEALRIKPDFQLARNNMMWAAAQKARPASTPN